jgi:hypothetical protein
VAWWSNLLQYNLPCRYGSLVPGPLLSAEDTLRCRQVS